MSQLITLGIGTPSDVSHLILFGLSPTGVINVRPILLCTATAVSLMPLRTAQGRIREVEALMPSRTVRPFCAGEDA